MLVIYPSDFYVIIGFDKIPTFWRRVITYTIPYDDVFNDITALSNNAPSIHDFTRMCRQLRAQHHQHLNCPLQRQKHHRRPPAENQQ